MEKDEFGVGLMDEGSTESSSPKEEAKTGLSFSVLPGFKCFFQNSVLKDNLTLQECYERVMKDHFILQKMRLPTEQLFKHSSLTLAERSKQLYYRSTATERFYIQSKNDPIFKYSYGKDKQEQIAQLKRQLELYQRSGVQALAKRRSELKEIREQKERLKQKEEEEKMRRAAVLEKLQRQNNQRIKGRGSENN